MPLRGQKMAPKRSLPLLGQKMAPKRFPPVRGPQMAPKKPFPEPKMTPKEFQNLLVKAPFLYNLKYHPKSYTHTHLSPYDTFSYFRQHHPHLHIGSSNNFSSQT